MRYYIEEDTSTTPPTLAKVPICGSYINYNTAPIGSIQQYSGTTLPPGWLFCNGSAYNRTYFPFLFKVIGTTYGSGDGSTTFNVPNIPDLATGIKYIIKAYSTADAKELGIDPGTIPDLPNFGTPIDVTDTFMAIADGSTWVAPWTGFVYFNTQNVTDTTHRISLLDATTNIVAAYAYVKNVGGYTADVGISGGMVVKGTSYIWRATTSTSLKSALLTPYVTDSTVPVDDPGEVYTTTETRVGTWIDGKPIYRKVFRGTTTDITVAGSRVSARLINDSSVAYDHLVSFVGTATWVRWPGTANEDRLEMSLNTCTVSGSLQAQFGAVAMIIKQQGPGSAGPVDSLQVYCQFVDSTNNQTSMDYQIIVEYTKR